MNVTEGLITFDYLLSCFHLQKNWHSAWVNVFDKHAFGIYIFVTLYDIKNFFCAIALNKYTRGNFELNAWFFVVPILATLMFYLSITKIFNEHVQIYQKYVMLYVLWTSMW